MAAEAVPPIERFYRHVSINPETGCHIWTGSIVGSKSRYPRFRHTTRASDPQTYAHRWIYEQLVGPIPEGMELDHTCRVSICVNPAHLEPVTPVENSRRARLDRCRADKHDLIDGANVRWDERGRRRGCLRCYEDRAAERSAALTRR